MSMLQKFGTVSQKNILYHFVVLGQSQAGAYNSVPALTTGATAGIRTLTNGPLNVSTGGTLISLVEGDTFSNTGGAGATSNVETIATSFANQLRSWMGLNCVVTIHAYGNSSIIQLGKGGSRGMYEEMIASISRVKQLATNEGRLYRCHLIFFHGGNTSSDYAASVIDLYNDFVSDVKPTYTTQSDVYMFTHQQRPLTPDLGYFQYSASTVNSNIIVVSPEYKTTYQGDGVHLTNHGERYMAMQFARAVYRKLTSDFKPLDLNITGASFNRSNMTLTIPVRNATLPLQKTSNAGIQVYSNTTSSVLSTTTAISGSSIVITFTDTNTSKPIGLHSLEVRTAIAANGELCDSSSAVDSVIYSNVTGGSINMAKYMVRALFNTNVWFPVNMNIKLGGATTDQSVTNWFSIWDATESTSNETYTIQGNVSASAVNSGANYWGFTDAGNNQKSGTQTVTGTNLYPNFVIGNWWFIENKTAGFRLNGLNTGRTYTLRYVGCRPNSATNRETTYTIGSSGITKTSNRSGTVSIYTNDSENAIFNSVSPDAGGQILCTLSTTTTFGYLNAVVVTEN